MEKKVSGKMVCLTEEDKWFIPMAVCMLDTLKMEFHTEKEDSLVLMDGIIKES